MKRTASLLFALAVLFCGHSFAAAERANFIVIRVDDMGWSVIGCYGFEIPTPKAKARRVCDLRRR